MMRTRLSAVRTWIAALLAVVALAALPFSASAAQGQLSSVRAATARYHSLRQAARTGYQLPPAGVPLHECIAALDGNGAMGFHYINGGLLDATLDPREPEVLVYTDRAGGSRRLVAAEYVVFQETWEAAHGVGSVPRLFGRDLTLIGPGNRFELPPFFEIHAWIWQPNPAGTFADFNPDASC